MNVHGMDRDALLKVLSLGTFTQAVAFLSSDRSLRDWTQNDDFMAELRSHFNIPDPKPLLAQSIEYESWSFERKIEFLILENNLRLLERTLRDCPEGGITLRDELVKKASIEAIRILRSSPCKVTLIWQGTSDISLAIVTKKGAILDDVLYDVRDQQHHKIQLRKLARTFDVVEGALIAGNVGIANALIPYSHYRILDTKTLLKYGNTETLIAYLKASLDKEVGIKDREFAAAVFRNSQYIAPAIESGIPENEILKVCLHEGYYDSIQELARLADQSLEDYLRDRDELSLSDNSENRVRLMYKIYSEIAESKGMSLVEYLVQYLDFYDLDFILDDYPSLVEDLDDRLISILKNKHRSRSAEIDGLIREAKDRL